MITYAQALELVNRELGQYLRTGDDGVVVVEPRTIERDFGWVFSYESRKALETNDIRYALSGNGPIIVDRYDGSLHRFGSLCSRRDAFDAYEAELAKRIDRETLGSILKEIARSLETNGHSNKAEFVAALVTILKWDHLASIPGLKSDVMWGGGTSISGVSEFNSPEDRESFVRLLLRLADLMRGSALLRVAWNRLHKQCRVGWRVLPSIKSMTESPLDPLSPPFQFRLRTLLLLFVVLGSSLAVFGAWGIVVFVLVVGLAAYLHQVESFSPLMHFVLVVLCLICLAGLLLPWLSSCASTLVVPRLRQSLEANRRGFASLPPGQRLFSPGIHGRQERQTYA